MKKNKNYKEFDSLTLYVKGTLSEKLIKYYKLLGWQLVNESENVRYEDIVDLTFSRPHNIDNKDELHLLQVYLEEKLNLKGKALKYKNSFSLSLCLFLMIIGLLFITLGILDIINVLNFFGLAINIVFIVFGSICILLCGIFIPKIVKREEKKYLEINSRLEKDIQDICKKASLLTGEKYGE